MTEVFAKEQLVQYITSLENMEREKAEIMEGIADILRDAKNNGFDTAILKHVLKLKKMDRNKLAELDTLIEVYREAAGV